MCEDDWNLGSSCINHYVDSFVDISDELIPAYELAFGVEIERKAEGWRDRSLVASAWSWLFPDLIIDEKTAEF